MDGIKIDVAGNIAKVIERPAKLTAGTVGLPVEFIFDEQWEGLSKTAVFRAGHMCKIVERLGTEAIVPWEILEKPGAMLHIGAYGVNEDGSVAIPTTWVKVTAISPSAHPDGDPSTDPTLPVYQELIDNIGDTVDLNTATKENLVEAINEVHNIATAGGIETDNTLSEEGKAADAAAVGEAIATHSAEVDEALATQAGQKTEQGGEIFNDYENNQALAPYAKAVGAGNRAGIHGYKLLTVEKDGEGYNITVNDAKLDSKAVTNYAAGDLLCFDGTNHYYDYLKIESVTKNSNGNSVIKVIAADGKTMPTLAVDSSKNEWENWVYVLKKPNAGEPAKVAYGAYAGGVGSVAVGYGAFAHGTENQSIGSYAYTAGRKNVAHYAGYAKGYNNKALGENSSAQGSGNTVTGTSADAAGMNNNVSGKGAHAHNSGNTASGVFSTASGLGNTASGEMSDAGGNGTKASGSDSFTRGLKTEASGVAATALGVETKAKGRGASAEGLGTLASGQYQHAGGKYNVEDTKNKYADIVGGGSSDTDRKNIRTLDWQGNAEYAGKVYSEGKELAKKEEMTPGNIGAVPTTRKINGYSLSADITLDAEKVGAAPNGYGLGTTCTHVAHWDEAIKNGWYCSKVGGPTADWWHGIVSNYSNAIIVQQVWNNSTPIKCYYRMNNQGTWTAWENRSTSAFAPSGFGLGAINPPLISNLNTCLNSGWYHTNEKTSNVPAQSNFKYSAVHVMARTSKEIVQRLIAVGNWQRLEMLRYTLDGGATWVAEYVNPPMVPNTEYRTTKRRNGYPVYTKLVSFGALPVGNGVNNAGFRQVSCGVNANKIISLTGYAYKDGEFNPLPMGMAGTLGAYTYVTGSDIGVTTMKDLSSCTAEFVIEYIK